MHPRCSVFMRAYGIGACRSGWLPLRALQAPDVGAQGLCSGQWTVDSGSSCWLPASRQLLPAPARPPVHAQVVIFVEGRGIATAKALLECSPDVVNLNIGFRHDVRVYYKVWSHGRGSGRGGGAAGLGQECR